MKKIIALLCFLLAACGVVFLILSPNYRHKAQVPTINSFEECSAAGYPVMQSYPKQCTLPSGRIFVQEHLPPQ